MSRSYQIDLRPRWRALGIVMAVLVLLSCWGDRGRTALRYDRAAIGAGEWWRLLTGHFVHLDWAHLGMNGAALLLLWALVGAEYSLATWGALALVAALAIGAGLWWFDPQLAWYVGLSGLLHAMACAGGIALLRRRRWEGAALLLLLAVKIVYEQTAGALPMHSSAMREQVVVDAHLYGAIAGAILGVCLAALRVRSGGARPL